MYLQITTNFGAMAYNEASLMRLNKEQLLRMLLGYQSMFEALFHVLRSKA